MQVLFYGRLADLIGREVHVQVPAGSSISELRRKLAAEHPRAEDVLLDKRVRACVGEQLVDDDYLLEHTDRVELLAPVSGG